jgi:hypothetical protein
MADPHAILAAKALLERRACSHDRSQWIRWGWGTCVECLADALAAPSQETETRGDGHASDCAKHNAPAYPAGPCDCRRSCLSCAMRSDEPGRLGYCRADDCWLEDVTPCERWTPLAAPAAPRDPGERCVHGTTPIAACVHCSRAPAPSAAPDTDRWDSEKCGTCEKFSARGNCCVADGTEARADYGACSMWSPCASPGAGGADEGSAT